MADIADPSQLDQASPSEETIGNGEPRGTKRARVSAAGDDDDDDDEKGGRERRKIDIKFIQDKSRRHITFSKRKAGIMKKVSTPSTIHESSEHHRVVTGSPENAYADFTLCIFRHMNSPFSPGPRSSC
jgi:hypothetical protein